MRVGALCFLLSMYLAACAPVGYHYDGFTVTPDDPCRLNEANETTSPQALSTLNATVGGPNGVPRQVAAMSNSSSIQDDERFKTIEAKLPAHGVSSEWCHVTLKYMDGTSENGVLLLADPGNNAPVQTAWLSDEEIDKAVADSVNASRQMSLKQNPTCALTKSLSDSDLGRCRIPKPALLQEVDDNRSIVYQWQASSMGQAARQQASGTSPQDRFGNKRILQLVTEQVCWEATSSEVINLELTNRKADIADDILSSILTSYDAGTTPNGGGGPWGPYTYSYLQYVDPKSVLTVVKDTAQDALDSAVDPANGTVARNLVTVQDVVNLIDACAQRHSKFITY